jgi:hypothetical protein
MEPFADLPDALVRDLLAKCEAVASGVSKGLATLREAKPDLRASAQERGLIKRKADLDVPREPSVAGVDGSYQIHHLTAIDLCAAAAVAVEGTSKEAKRYWPQPYHEMWVESLPHSAETTSVLRGMMVSMELSLAHQAPHDLVLLDGSFASLIIYLNQGLVALEKNAPLPIVDAFLSRWQGGIMDRLTNLLNSDRTVAVPKFTARNDLQEHLSVLGDVAVDGKTLATMLLESGEYTKPLPILAKAEKYHLPDCVRVRGQNVVTCSAADLREMDRLLHELRVVYYRPYGWLPALRLELPGVIANSNSRLALVLEGIARQFFSPAVFETYPLFLADRMVKSLGAGVAVIEHAVAQQVVGDSPDIETTLLFLQNYRTEGGRGGV